MVGGRVLRCFVHGGHDSALWAMVEFATEMAESICVDRDLAAGVRLGGFLIAIGLILGRAVAGDWVSTQATLGDFLRQGWPALMLVPAAVTAERRARPTPQTPAQPVLWRGLLVSLLYVGFAALCVEAAG